MRVFNFHAGPATLPLSVLERARDELLDFDGAGMSVMEMSHRGERFKALAHDAEMRLRRLLDISDEYAVLFLQGGARMQFSAVPLNLLGGSGRADYVDTGMWSQLAIEEARRYGCVNVAASAADSSYSTIPEPGHWRLDPDADYVHYTPNETVGGVEFHDVPDVGDVALVADASSTILSRPLPVSRFGVIYAGAQKNVGIAGLTLVIVRRALFGRHLAHIPSLLRYDVQDAQESMANTAPTFAWYVAGLVFQWLEERGGVAAMAAQNVEKASALYACIDASNFYSCPVMPACRSRMNVVFTLAAPELDARFVQEAQAAGLSGLKGHRSLGGMRASLYNAMPLSGVHALVEFMQDFEARVA